MVLVGTVGAKVVQAPCDGFLSAARCKYGIGTGVDMVGGKALGSMVEEGGGAEVGACSMS